MVRQGKMRVWLASYLLSFLFAEVILRHLHRSEFGLLLHTEAFHGLFGVICVFLMLIMIALLDQVLVIWLLILKVDGTGSVCDLRNVLVLLLPDTP